MIEAVRVTITAYTASFRVPHFVGYQLTLPVPPLSTIYGLISAAAGRWVLPQEVEWLAYKCEYESKADGYGEAILQTDWNAQSPSDFAQKTSH
jgi:CRISPR-associated protein Cas5t